MYSVNYHRAASVADAVKKIKAGDGKYLVRRHDADPTMKTAACGAERSRRPDGISRSEGHQGRRART
jgi:hypothetical protein